MSLLQVADCKGFGGETEEQVGEDKTELVEKQETLRASLASRFSKSEARIGQLNSTMSFLENQIAAWNKSD